MGCKTTWSRGWTVVNGACPRCCRHLVNNDRGARITIPQYDAKTEELRLLGLPDKLCDFLSDCLTPARILLDAVAGELVGSERMVRFRLIHDIVMDRSSFRLVAVQQCLCPPPLKGP